MRPKTRIAGLLCALVLVAGCADPAEEPVAEANASEPVADAAESEPEAKILIATRDTEFKRLVIDAVRRDLAGERWAIEVTDVTDRAVASAGDYDVVVIMDHLESGRLSGVGFQAVARVPDESRLVLLVTSRTPGWQPDDEDVDAVTSPSSVSFVEAVATEVAAHVRAHVGGV
jgi:hypothetical protein